MSELWAKRKACNSMVQAAIGGGRALTFVTGWRSHSQLGCWRAWAVPAGLLTGGFSFCCIAKYASVRKQDMAHQGRTGSVNTCAVASLGCVVAAW